MEAADLRGAQDLGVRNEGETAVTSAVTSSAHAAIVRVLDALWTGQGLDETQIIDLLSQAAADTGPAWTPPSDKPAYKTHTSTREKYQ